MLKYGLTAAVAFAAGLLLAETDGLAQAVARLPKGIAGLMEGQAKPPSANWLLDAKDDAERFRRLQIFAGGTYEQMWQIGYRYEQVHRAITDENWDLAAHHWTKLRDVFNIALMKRPNRTPNAEALFLDENWRVLDAALKAKDAAKARDVFVSVERQACLSCHIAEGMEFLNNTPLFRNTASFPAKR